MYANIIKNDLEHIWHPCSYMQDFKTHPPLVIESAKGSYITTNQGILIDAISSWWCKSLGHGHPRVISEITKQLQKFEHVITANTTNPVIAELGEKLAEISNKQRLFFASDGSSAVEIAMKLALQASQLKGFPEKNKFISLKNSYHGETFATMSVSDLGLYKKPFQKYDIFAKYISNIPYLNNTNDPLWYSCENIWPEVLKQLDADKNQIAAILVEPIIQGAAGMYCYSADFLQKIREYATNNNIFLITDEIMTGIGRTGKWFASNHANIEGDMICLSKGLTSGTLPLSVVLIDDSIYDLFHKNYAIENSFLHSHTYSGNPLAVSAALATINTIQEEDILTQSAKLGEYMHIKFKEIASQTMKLSNVRGIGAIVAADLIDDDKERIGYRISLEAEKRGALLRPIGNTLYWLPPLNTPHQTIDKLADITYESIMTSYVNKDLRY
ncbi:MAG: adenosylmethionine--8-amino-7-oxononanoate transaminase [Legionellales bacterium RIFCSPHIGHO2_12_FULL_35_11]|nr:MAG: adenosylmethionine--8-amino-7-oxononanoate transaminase [Legionellales bacterium RIFCSPHIGHO2_12_FULL_35_11]